MFWLESAVKSNLISVSYSARQQERQVCAKLANKGYEPPWKTLQVETVDDWWGMAKMGARVGGKLQSILLDGNKKNVLIL